LADLFDLCKEFLEKLMFTSPSQLRHQAIKTSLKGNDALTKGMEANKKAREQRILAEKAKAEQEIRRLEEEAALLEQEVLDQEEAIAIAFQGIQVAERALFEAKAEHAQTIDYAKTLGSKAKKMRELVEEYRKELSL
jgi:hypothetical protein